MKATTLILLVSACAASPADLRASVQINDSPSGIYAVAGFDDSDSPTVEVDAAITLRVRGQTFELHPRDGAYTRSLELSPPAEADEPFEVTIDIDGEMRSATVTAPPALDFVGDVPLFLSRSIDQTVSWQTPTSDNGFWNVIACTNSVDGVLEPDATSLTIPRELPRDDQYGTCTASLEIDRVRATPIPGFADGSVAYVRYSVTAFASTP